MANYTLNYTGEKVDELLNKIDTAFGEETVMGDTLIWNGDTNNVETIDPTGTGQMLLCHVSDIVPTSSDFANGAKLTFGNDYRRELTADEILPLGNGVLTESSFAFVVVSNDNTTVTVPYSGITLTVTFPKKGVYFGKTVGVSFTRSLTINGYTGFESIAVDKIPSKFVSQPEPSVIYRIETDTIGNIMGSEITCDKTLSELFALPVQKLMNTQIIWNNTAVFSPFAIQKYDDSIVYQFFYQEENQLFAIHLDHNNGIDTATYVL